MKKHKNSVISLKCCTDALPDFNQSLALIYSVLLLTTHAHAAVWLSKSHTVSGVKLWTVMGQ